MKKTARVMFVPSKGKKKDGEIVIRIPVKGFNPASVDLEAYCCGTDSGTWNTIQCTKKSNGCASGHPITVWM